jgi:hypothetical protein
VHLGFIRELLAQVVAKRTGLLEVQTEDSKTRLYLKDGIVVYADQGTVGETLGRILLREKVINEAAYERVLEAMARARQDGKFSKFGEVMVELGILQPSQVDAALAAQVQHKVLNCLKWEDVTFTFAAKDLPREIREFPIEIEPLLLKAMRLIDHEQKLSLLGEHGLSRPELVSPAAKLVSLLRLKTPEARFIRSIEGKLTTAELLDVEVPDSVDPELLLCVLALSGHVRFNEPSPAERQKQSAAPSAPPPQRRKRVDDSPPSTKRGRRKSAMRSRFLRLHASEQKRIKHAALRLRSHARETSPGGPLSIGRISVPSVEAAALVAEQQYRRGRRHLRENRLAEAMVAFKRAVDLEPNVIEYRLYAAWASFRELPEKEGDRVAAVRAIARRAIKENADFGFAHYVLSHLAMREGNRELAEDLLRRARKLDPESIEGEKPLRIAKGQAPKGPPPLPKHVVAVTTPAPASAVSLAAPMGLKAGAKPPALPPSLPTPPAMPRPAPKAEPPKLPPPSIFTDSSSKVKAPSSPEIAKQPSSPQIAKAPSSPEIAKQPSSPQIAKAPSSPEIAKQPSSPQITSAPSSSQIAAARADGMPPPPTAEPDPSFFRKPSHSAPESERQAPPKKQRSIVLPAVIIGLVLGAGAGIFALSTSAANDPPKPAKPIETTPSLVTTAPAATSTTTTMIATTTTTTTTTTTSTPTPTTTTTSTPTPTSTSTSTPTTTTTSTSTPTSTSGILVAPALSKGRRVFVDGKSIGEGPGELTAPCGSHEVRIGSAGKPRTVDIPCGGKLDL